ETAGVRSVNADLAPGRRYFEGHADRELRAPAAVDDGDDVALPRAVAHPAPDQRVAPVRARARREAAAAQRHVERGSDPIEEPWQSHRSCGAMASSRQSTYRCCPPPDPDS